MSRKSKHKPKGPKNPPQNQQQAQPAPAQPAPAQQAPTQPEIVEQPQQQLNPPAQLIEVKQEVKPDNQKEPEKKTDQPDGAPSGSGEAPSKPKRNRNRNKKNKNKQSDDAEQGDEEATPAETPKEAVAEKKIEEPKPAEEKVATEVKEEPKVEQKQGKKDKKDKGRAQQENKKDVTEQKSEIVAAESEVKKDDKKSQKKDAQKKDQKAEPAAPEVCEAATKKSDEKKCPMLELKSEVCDNKKSQGKPQEDKKDQKKDKSEGSQKNKKEAKETQKAVTAPACEIVAKKSEDKQEEKKIESEKKVDEVQVCDIATKAEEKKVEAAAPEAQPDTADDSKNQKGKKSKNKNKNKDNQDVVKEEKKTAEEPKVEKETPKAEEKPSEVAVKAPEPKICEIKPSEESVKPPEVIVCEMKPIIAIPPEIITREIKTIEIKPLEEKPNTEIEAEKNKPEGEHHANKGEKKNKKGNKKGQKPDVVEESEKIDTAKNSEQKTMAANIEIAPPASVCSTADSAQNRPSENIEDDILPSLASSIEKTLEELIVCESDIVLNEQLKQEEDKKKAEKDKHDKKSKKDKKQRPAEETKPAEAIELKQEAISEVVKAEEQVVAQPVAAAEAPKEKPVEEAKKDAVEHLKVEERAVSKSPTRKEKRKKSPKPPKSEPIAQDKSPQEAEKKGEDISNKTSEPVIASSVPDDIINQLLSDVPPPFVEEKQAEVKNEILPPITKSKTILEDIPTCEMAKKDDKKEETKTEGDANDLKLSDSLLNVCQIESNIEKEMKKALEVALGIIVNDIPPLQMQPAPTEEKRDEVKIPDKNMEDNLIMASVIIQDEPQPPADKAEESKGKGKKSKKHDKHKSDSAEASKSEEVSQPVPADQKSITEVKPAEQQTEVKPTEQKSTDAKPAEQKQEEAKPSEEPKPSEKGIESKPSDIKDEASKTESPKPMRRNKDKKHKGKGGDGTKGISSEQSQSQQSSQTQSSEQGEQKQKESNKSADEKKQDDNNTQGTKQEQKDSDSPDHSNAPEKRPDEAAGSSEAKPNEFEFLKIPESALRCPVVDETKKEVKDKSKRKSPPKNQPKNLLGLSKTPAKSNKYDYKKEKNKDPETGDSELAKVEMRNLDPDDMPELVDNDAPQRSALPQNEIPASTRQNFDKTKIVEYEVADDDDDEEFVYKYSFRTVFIANACHVCKASLKDERVVCRFCHLVGYCGEKHRDDDWTLHQSLCYAVSTLANAKGQSHIYEDAKSLNGQDYRLLRMQAIVSCEKLLKRKLCPWEQEALLYPRICAQPSCRDWRTASLKDCSGCGQISYCSDAHLPPDHATWCQPYKLYHKLVSHQLNHGRLEPQLPNKIPPIGYTVPDKSTTLFDDLYGSIASTYFSDYPSVVRVYQEGCSGEHRKVINMYDRCRFY